MTPSSPSPSPSDDRPADALRSPGEPMSVAARARRAAMLPGLLDELDRAARRRAARRTAARSALALALVGSALGLAIVVSPSRGPALRTIAAGPTEPAPAGPTATEPTRDAPADQALVGPAAPNDARAARSTPPVRVVRVGAGEVAAGGAARVRIVRAGSDSHADPAPTHRVQIVRSRSAPGPSLVASISDRELVVLLADIGRPAGLIRDETGTRLTRPVADNSPPTRSFPPDADPSSGEPSSALPTGGSAHAAAGRRA